jgi:hypothetical protein
MQAAKVWRDVFSEQTQISEVLPLMGIDLSIELLL